MVSEKGYFFTPDFFMGVCVPLAIISLYSIALYVLLFCRI